MFYDTFKHICKLKGVSPTKVVTDLKLSSGNMTNWKNGRTPKMDVAKKIADYLNVSLSELMGWEKEKEPSSTDDSKSEIIDDIVTKLGNLSDVNQKMVLEYIDLLHLKESQ